MPIQGAMTETADDDVMIAPFESSAEVEEEVHINEEDDEPSEEANPAQFLCSPTQPTDLDMEQHRCDHQPYRS
jgi:hypothetical protein